MNVDLQKSDAARAWDAVEEIFPLAPAKPTDNMTLIERETVSNYRYNFLADRAKIILKHFTIEGATERINELVIAPRTSESLQESNLSDLVKGILRCPLCAASWPSSSCVWGPG